MSETTNTPVKKKKGLSAQAIVSIVIICLLIAIPAGIYFWKQAEISKLKKQHETEIIQIRTDATNTITDNNKKNMETLTRVFSWAVRSEMLRNNLDQVNTYMTDLVKAADLNDISAIKTDGIVVLSTNKKFEGNAYPGPVASQLSQINEVVSQNDADGNIMSICPIMGLDSRLGTIVITYKPKTYVFGNQE
ncbi:MAG: hypothetical protein WCL06_14255 [Bacteroidota bacterium]